MGLLDSFAVAALEGIPRRLWGFSPRLMPVIVERLGAIQALSWFGSNMPRYEQTLRAFGGIRTHLLCVVISLVNGCAYCAFGHAYALELIYLKERGELFPLDENAITELRQLGRVEVRDRLADALHEAELGDEVGWIDRTLALLAGTREPADRDDARITHLIRMFAVLNACGIAGDVTPDAAHDPANKDRALNHRYVLLRSEPTSGPAHRPVEP